MDEAGEKQKMAKFYRKKLKNGMIVLFEKRRGCGVVSIAFATKYGGLNEPLKEKGIAHFIEHMLYKGTPTRNAMQISEAIEKRGGVMNGFTSEQMTAFWCKMPSKHLLAALDVLGDMIKNPLFDRKEMDKERKVIFEEMKMWKDNPHLRVHERIIECLFKGSLGMKIIGSEKTLNSISKEKICRRFKKAYSTNNLVLCVVGDADFGKICNFAERTFEKTKAKISIQKIILQNKHAIEKRKGVDQANIIFAYHVPKATNEKHYAAQVLTALMAGGSSSRLFQEIREKRNLAYVVRGACNIDKDFGYNTIFIGTTKEKIAPVKTIILDEFENLKNLTAEELEEIKEQLIGNNKISKEDSQGQMLELLSCEIIGKPKEAYEYEKKIRKVKLKDIKHMASSAVKKHSFFALVPE